MTGNRWISMSIEDRLYGRLIPGGPNGECRLWTGADNGKGYGTIRYESRAQLTHRVALKLSGVDVPDDLLVLHSCHVKKCCNADHLYLGDQKSKCRKQRIVNPRPQATHCAKGHEFSEANTYYRPPDFKHRTCRQCKVAYDRRRFEEATLSGNTWQRKYSEDPEYREYMREWGKRYRAANPEKARAACVRHKYRLREDMTAEDILVSNAYRLVIRQDFCFYCGVRKDDMHYDHFFPLAKGGTDHWWNLVRACSTCNLRKQARCGTAFILRCGNVL